MKILLVNPPSTARSIPVEKYGLTSMKRIFRGEPYGLEVLAGGLAEHDLIILDLKVDQRPLSKTLDSFRPDVVGFTGVTCEAGSVVALAAEARKSGAVVVVGGIHATYDPNYYNRPEFDYVVIGLGTASFRGLIRALETGFPAAGIPGVARVDAAQPLSYQSRRYTRDDLPGNPPPRYDLVEQYRPHYVLGSLGLQVGFVASSYGCPFNCSFCSVGKLTGGRYLPVEAEIVLRDIGLLDNVPLIRFVDANTFSDEPRARLLAQTLESAGLMKQYVAEARVDSVVDHPDLFARWTRIGLKYVVVGFEEISDARLARFNKKATRGQNSEAAHILADLGLTVAGDFIISPDYEGRDFDALAEFIQAHRIGLPMLTILTPLPGTPLFQEMKDHITIHDLDYYTLLNAVVPTRLPEDVFYSRYTELMKNPHQKAGM